VNNRGLIAVVKKPAVFLACAVLAGCGGDGRRPSVVPVPTPSDSDLNLGDAFRFAAAHREAASIDLGTPTARPHLGEGWSHDENSALGRSAVWAMGPRSVVRFFVSDPRSFELELRCWALPAPSLGPQITAVSVNGEPVGTLTIRPNRGSRYRIAVSETVLRAGENTLAFNFAWSVSPVDVLPDSDDRRRLSVMFDEIVFDGLVDAEAPELIVTDAAEYLRVPPRSAVSFFVNVPPHASLWLGRVAFERNAGVDDCVLEIGIETESGARSTRVIRPGDSGPEPIQVPVSSDDGEIAGISFAARAARGDAGCRVALNVVEPHIVAGPTEGAALDPGVGDPEPSLAAAERPPNILIYLIDCLRADHLGTYGYDRGVSPRIDRFARDSVVFEHLAAAASWTRPAVASLLTGLTPQAHGTRGDRTALSGSVPVIQEILRAEGYVTAAVITNGVVSSKFGFGRGFDDFRYLPEQHEKNPEIHELSDRVNEEIFDWLGGRDAARPFFMYVHTTDPHAPYLPRSPYRERFAAATDPAIGLHPAVESLTRGRTVAGPGVRQGLMDLYDGEIAFNDEHFGRLLDRLESEGLYDDTLIVLTADHGEEFEDHGRWEHGLSLYQEMLHVPLVVKLPAGRNAGLRRAEQVSQIDIAPTLLEAAGLDVPATMMGRSLRPWGHPDAAALVDRPAVADLARDPRWRVVNAVISGGTKLIRNHTYDLPRPTRELYDLETDTAERGNLAAERRVIAGYLEMLLRQAAETDRYEAPTAELSVEDEERLRALGYLE